LLLAKGYTVHGLIRRASTFHTQRIEHLYQDPHDPETRVGLHYGDLSASPYAAAKLYAYWMVRNYREGYVRPLRL